MVGVTVMARIDLRGADLSAAQLRAALPRGGVDVDAALPTVRPIVDAVAERGADAALEYGESFDGVRPADRPGARPPSWTPRWPVWTADVRTALRGGDRTHPRRARRPAPHRYHDRRWRPAPPSPNGGCPSSGSGSTCPAATPSTRPAW